MLFAWITDGFWTDVVLVLVVMSAILFHVGKTAAKNEDVRKAAGGVVARFLANLFR